MSKTLEIIAGQAEDARRASNQANERMEKVEEALKLLKEDGRNHGYSDALSVAIMHVEDHFEARRCDAHFRLGYAEAMERAQRIATANGEGK